MCPACIQHVALLAVGATSAGGVMALIVQRLRFKTSPKDVVSTTREEEQPNQNQKENV